MTDDLGDVLDLLPGAGEPTVLGELGGSSRSTVHRVRTGDRTVVVKRFATGGGGFPREAAALSVLPPDAPAPRLLGVRDDPPTVVLSDVGTGPSVADLLLGGDPAAARDGVLSWASALARLHDCTVDRGDAFRAALAARTDQPASALPGQFEEAIIALEAHCAELGVSVAAGVWDDLRGLYGRLTGGPAVLSPGDTCPDNNVATPGGRVLLDFESADWWHPAWDVAYLVVPWPSCWCAWRLPDEVTGEALRGYRAASTLPWAASDAFGPDVEAAAAGWAVLTTAWFLPRAMAGDPPPADPAKRMPGRRAMILNRLAVAEAYRPGGHSAAALSAFAGELRATLLARWGDVPLPYAPAFSRAVP